MKQACLLPQPPSSLQDTGCSLDCSRQGQRAPSPPSPQPESFTPGTDRTSVRPILPSALCSCGESQSSEISRWARPCSSPPSLKGWSVCLDGLPENTVAPINLPLAFKIVIPCQERQSERTSGCCPPTPDPRQVPRNEVPLRSSPFSPPLAPELWHRYSPGGRNKQLQS